MESKIIEKIKSILVGNYITGYSTSDSYCLFLNDYYLVFQDLNFKEENKFNEYIYQNYQEFNLTLDKEIISKNTFLVSNIRKEISNVFLDKDSSLNLCFNEGINMKITTDTNIVDWQWSINKTGDSPYHGVNELTCFWKGEIELK